MLTHLARAAELVIAGMIKALRGIYRTTAWAYVTNGAMAFQVPEADYRAFGYEPDYEKLPWKESYDAAANRRRTLA